VDRLVEPELGDVAKLVRPEILGLDGTRAAQHVELSMTQTRFTLSDANITARWGRLPANGTHDPNTVEPINQPSWMLDLDMFTREQTVFDVDALVSKCRSFAERIYTIFRWTVTDEFLRRYGGDP
jgi:uncharacterized protein (TIGR04255 family)